MRTNQEISAPWSHAEEARADQDGLRRSILDSLPFSIIATDVAGNVVTANPAAERLLGYTSDELVGRPVSVIHAEPPGSAAVTAPDQHEEREAVYRRRDGSQVPVNEANVVLRDPDGTPSGLLTVAYDNTRRKQAEEFARHLAQHDQLTDLPNRSRLLNHLVHAIDHAEREGTEVVVLLLDLDHFKDINDTLGHHAGDQLVVRMAMRLRECVREGDLVARIGGDEFVVVFADVEKGAQLDARIDRLVRTVSAPIDVGGTELIVTTSAGGVSYPADGDPAALLQRADTAMYHSKAAGRNMFTWFRAWMLDETNDKVALSAALRHSLTAGELDVAYQPVISLVSGEVVGMEALARWESPEHGVVGPGRFIPIAEESGMIVELGEWVLRRACSDAVELQRVLGRRLKLAVNVSPRQLRSPDWSSVLAGALADSGLEPGCLEIEITEGIVMDDPGHALDVLGDVRRLGVDVVVDDFGTGYSSLAYLTRLPINKIKIDQSFVQDLTTGGPGATIAETIIVMAHTLGLKVLAEGIEDEAQREYLQERGCDEGQGFLYSPAVPASHFLSVAAGVDSAPRTVSP